MSVPLIDKLVAEGLDRRLLWRGRELRAPTDAVISSGWPVLDDCLGGGWPRGALIELLSRRGLGLSLALPLLARESRAGRWIGWIAPPHSPFLPALSQAGVAVSRLLRVEPRDDGEGLWAAEQMLRSGDCGVVMIWSGRLSSTQVRRLQLAAAAGDAAGLLFCPLRDAARPSPAALRLRLLPAPLGLEVEVLKRRGGWGARRCLVPLSRR